MGGLDEFKKTTQTVMNENPFITFAGTGLRTFSFTYLMVPESEGEVKSIYDIILYFREHMYPEKVGEMALSFPNVFGIEFKNVAYPKMPECALTDVEITYNKNSASFFVGPEGYPVQVDMTLSFKELMPIYKQHIRKGF
jgi:LEA14-like dessication related protein